jgi:hypothetical protein
MSRALARKSTTATTPPNADTMAAESAAKALASEADRAMLAYDDRVST